MSGFINPTQQLDWRGFSSNNILELYSAKIEILREVTPQVTVATNPLGFLKILGHWKWSRQQNFIATDVRVRRPGRDQSGRVGRLLGRRPELRPGPFTGAGRP